MILSLATLNTWKCDGAYLDRLDLIANTFENDTPDILACQEVFASIDKKYDTANFISSVLKLNANYFPSRRKVRNVANELKDSYSGLCVFTDLSIEREKQLVLPSDLVNDGERTAQLFTVVVQGFRFCIVNTHLTHLSTAQHLRDFQMDAIFEAIELSDYDAVFIMGDLNTTPDTSLIAAIEKKRGFTTFFPDCPPTIHDRCIDYIFYKSNKLITVRQAKVIGNTPSDKGVFPSDHFGLYVTIEIH